MTSCYQLLEEIKTYNSREKQSSKDVITEYIFRVKITPTWNKIWHSLSNKDNAHHILQHLKENLDGCLDTGDGGLDRKSQVMLLISIIYEENSTRYFAYIYPTKIALSKIYQLCNRNIAPLKIVSIFSGNALWEAILRKKYGINIISTDIAIKPQDNKYYISGTPFMEVEQIDAISAVKKYKVDILMMIYPPINDIAEQCLDLFEGNYIIYGRENGGATANDGFHQKLDKYWNLKSSSSVDKHLPEKIPFDMGNSLQIWERKP